MTDAAFELDFPFGFAYSLSTVGEEILVPFIPDCEQTVIAFVPEGIIPIPEGTVPIYT